MITTTLPAKNDFPRRDEFIVRNGTLDLNQADYIPQPTPSSPASPRLRIRMYTRRSDKEKCAGPSSNVDQVPKPAVEDEDDSSDTFTAASGLGNNIRSDASIGSLFSKLGDKSHPVPIMNKKGRRSDTKRYVNCSAFHLESSLPARNTNDKSKGVDEDEHERERVRMVARRSTPVVFPYDSVAKGVAKARSDLKKKDLLMVEEPTNEDMTETEWLDNEETKIVEVESFAETYPPSLRSFKSSESDDDYLEEEVESDDNYDEDEVESDDNYDEDEVESEEDYEDEEVEEDSSINSLEDDSKQQPEPFVTDMAAPMPLEESFYLHESVPDFGQNQERSTGSKAPQRVCCPIYSSIEIEQPVTITSTTTYFPAKPPTMPRYRSSTRCTSAFRPGQQVDTITDGSWQHKKHELIRPGDELNKQKYASRMLNPKTVVETRTKMVKLTVPTVNYEMVDVEEE